MNCEGHGKEFEFRSSCRREDRPAGIKHGSDNDLLYLFFNQILGQEKVQLHGKDQKTKELKTTLTQLPMWFLPPQHRY